MNIRSAPALVFLLLVGACAELDPTTSSPSTSDAHRADGVVHFHYAAPNADGWKVVANAFRYLGTEELNVVYETEDGWQVAKAEGVWRFNPIRAYFDAQLPPLDRLRFALQHRRTLPGVGSEQVWDNNGGFDYHSADGEPLLGEGVNIAIVHAEAAVVDGSHHFSAEIVVRNLAYDKEVEIVLTTDGWETRQVLAARYDRGGSNGAEIWKVDGVFTRTLPWASVHFGAVARQNGEEMVDGSIGTGFPYYSCSISSDGYKCHYP